MLIVKHMYQSKSIYIRTLTSSYLHTKTLIPIPISIISLQNFLKINNDHVINCIIPRKFVE